jgi:uncharacterized protein
VLVAAEDEDISAVPEDLRALGAEVEAVRVDLAKAEGVDQLYQAVAALGRPSTRSP